MELILSTSNIIDAGSFDFRRDARSNKELVESLRSNLQSHLTSVNSDNPTTESLTVPRPNVPQWTTRTGDTLEVPTLHLDAKGLQEEREQYDITLKLFLLSKSSSHKRENHARQALALVSKELAVSSVDLLIVSHPGIYFDEQEDCPEKLQTRAPVTFEPEEITSQLETWLALEKLHDEGLVQQLGVAECGHDRLQTFLKQSRIKPSVDQINLRDCCSVPKDLLQLAKENQVALLVHNDCTDILPRGTVRELLGTGAGGARILADKPKVGEKRKSLHGDTVANGDAFGSLSGEVHPQWVVKYTAVVKDRGVVENKGYFAMAELETE